MRARNKNEKKRIATDRGRRSDSDDDRRESSRGWSESPNEIGLSESPNEIGWSESPNEVGWSESPDGMGWSERKEKERAVRENDYRFCAADPKRVPAWFSCEKTLRSGLSRGKSRDPGRPVGPTSSDPSDLSDPSDGEAETSRRTKTNRNSKIELETGTIECVARVTARTGRMSNDEEQRRIRDAERDVDPIRSGRQWRPCLTAAILVLLLIALVLLVGATLVGRTNGGGDCEKVGRSPERESAPVRDPKAASRGPTEVDDPNARDPQNQARSVLSSVFGALSAVAFCLAAIVVGKK